MKTKYPKEAVVFILEEDEDVILEGIEVGNEGITSRCECHSWKFIYDIERMIPLTPAAKDMLAIAKERMKEAGTWYLF